jgi:pyrroline-5-carboxylate reductase
VHFTDGCGYGFRVHAFGVPRNDGEAIMSSLQNFSGTLVLVGAGKMGSAMLEGWLALGLDPNRIAIL